MKALEIKKKYDILMSVKEKKLPVKVAFIISRNMTKMENIVADLEDKKREIIIKYAEKDEDENPIINEEGNVKILDMKKFTEEINDILSVDLSIDFDMINMIDVQKIDLPEFDSLTLDELSALDCMINQEV